MHTLLSSYLFTQLRYILKVSMFISYTFVRYYKLPYILISGMFNMSTVVNESFEISPAKLEFHGARSADREEVYKTERYIFLWHDNLLCI